MRIAAFTFLLFGFALSAQTTTSTHVPTAGTGVIAMDSTSITCAECGFATTGTFTIAPNVWRGPQWSVPIKHKHTKLTAIQIDRNATVINRAELAPAAYLKAAAEIGMENPSTEEARLLVAIEKFGYHVYDYQQVSDYMDDQAAKMGENTQWVWKPLRKKDADDNHGWHTVRMLPDALGIFDNAVYARRVPETVMVEAKELLSEMPDVVFLVTDYEVIKPDPFLAVTTRALIEAGKVWIIDRWNEPGFTEKTAYTRLMAGR